MRGSIDSWTQRFLARWQPQWKSALGSNSSESRLWLCGRQSRWYQASQSSHWIHCTVSCCGRRQCAAAQGSTPCATPTSTSSSSSEDEEEDDEEEEELEEDDDEGEGREGRGSGCFLGLPRRRLQKNCTLINAINSYHILLIRNWNHFVYYFCIFLKR